MRDFVRELGRLTTFLIFARAVVYLRPKESYEKYLRLLTGLILLLQFLGPVRQMLCADALEIQVPWEEEVLGDRKGDLPLPEPKDSGEESGISEEIDDVRIEIKEIEIAPWNEWVDKDFQSESGE